MPPFAPLSMKPLLALILLSTVLVGCVTPEPPLYRWGAYEDIIYQPYKNPGESDPVTDATSLSEDMARTEAEGQQIPPGVRVQLGYLYYNQGNTGRAVALFKEERAVFPESAVFIDGLLERMKAQR